MARSVATAELNIGGSDKLRPMTSGLTPPADLSTRWATAPVKSRSGAAEGTKRAISPPSGVLRERSPARQGLLAGSP
eukprot:CAMPEP_0197676824 /NCGR_PEP_ID=MMETSP1338-20131121/87433_1 /TAXON_ID=43686 ORGANISM="Pelagodinium beii, Strain RCC1491" /NCGR_SAMPLE_ID=MMETSP1338 /ASSEMBLY_ACC=CAM_ASM_000754 /LENGTH=76 /DNA_ID=CAMNT_0043257557 /DNA_START=60 /DNA_END=286 /DNA_ORIENTATION=+